MGLLEPGRAVLIRHNGSDPVWLPGTVFEYVQGIEMYAIHDAECGPGVWRKNEIVLDTAANRRKKNVPIKVKPGSEKVRCDNTWTEGRFWSFIRTGLRQISMRWRPIQSAFVEARRKYTAGINKRQKWEFLCANCGGWFMRKNVDAHHLEPCGKMTCAADLPTYVERMFCEKDKIKIICETCHKREHDAAELESKAGGTVPQGQQDLRTEPVRMDPGETSLFPTQ